MEFLLDYNGKLGGMIGGAGMFNGYAAFLIRYLPNENALIYEQINAARNPPDDGALEPSLSRY